MLYERTTDRSVDETVKRIEEAVPRHSFGVLGVHDMKQKMNSKGVDFSHECRVVEVCNPVQACKVLEANPSISNALPCRISVFEKEGQTVVSTVLPTKMLGMFGETGLDEVAAEVEQTIEAIIDEATR